MVVGWISTPDGRSTRTENVKGWLTRNAKRVVQIEVAIVPDARRDDAARVRVALDNGSALETEKLSFLEAMDDLLSSKSLRGVPLVVNGVGTEVHGNLHRQLIEEFERSSGTVAPSKRFDTSERHISHGFYRVTDAEAGRLAKPTGRPLPDFSREIRVKLPDGRMAWLGRTPYRYFADAPARGWIWAIHEIEREK